MTVSFLTVTILSLIFAALFFIVDFYEHSHPKLHVSLIAGISLAYFFLVLLPEVSVSIPAYPFNTEIFEFLFVVVGFSFVHVSEKLILQKVEAKSQRRMRKLLQKELTLEQVEKSIENILKKELKNDNLDEMAIKDIAQTISSLNEQENEIKSEINQYKSKIQNRISEDLGRLRFFTNFTYHFLIGIILFGLLMIELIQGILFFFFGWFRAIVTNRSEAHIIFTDLEIYEKIDIEEKSIRKYILALSTLTGVIIGIIFEAVSPINLELLYVLYSFVSGVILYTIVREIIPEKEKGKPIYFLIGFIGFILLIFTIDLFTSIL